MHKTFSFQVQSNSNFRSLVPNTYHTWKITKFDIINLRDDDAPLKGTKKLFLKRRIRYFGHSKVDLNVGPFLKLF